MRLIQSDALTPSLDLRGQRVLIFIVAYNALTTLSSVLKRITPDVWRNVQQVAVFDDASRDETYELAVGIQAMASQPKNSSSNRRERLRSPTAARA